MRRHLWILGMLVGTLSLQSCRSVEKMLDEGRYDELLLLAERRLAGKKVNKEKYVIAAEAAFRKVTERDMARIERLKQSKRSADWQEIAVIASRIDRRQTKLLPFLPLVSDNGYQAKFNFVKVDEIMAHAEARIIESLYEESLVELRLARDGNKKAAQRAYGKLQEILEKGGEYRDVYALRQEARDLGTIHVLTQMENRIHGYLPGYVEEVLDESISAGSGSFWIRYYDELPSGITPDYIVRFVVTGLEVGPESLSREELRRSRKIEDGWDYVLDSNGNVAKDSLGNDFKVKRYREVSAVVVKTYQEKGAWLRATFELVDAADNHILEMRPLQVENRFHHQAQSFYGDERAIDKHERIHIGLIPFPSDESMMLNVAEMIRPIFSGEIEKTQFL